MRQHEIMQTNYRQVFKETIKVVDKQERYSRVETSFIKLFCKRDSTRSQSKYDFMLNILKSIVFNLSIKNIY